jgi:predicted nucleotidyltransferase
MLGNLRIAGQDAVPSTQLFPIHLYDTINRTLCLPLSSRLQLQVRNLQARCAWAIDALLHRTNAMTIHQEQLEKAVKVAQEYGATRLILFGSALNRPDEAQDLDLACDGVTGWKLYELGARLEEELRLPLDLIPLTPSTRFTRLIERRGKVLL